MANEKERREDEIEIKKAVKELSINEIDEIMFSSPDSAADEEYEEESDPSDSITGASRIIPGTSGKALAVVNDEKECLINTIRRNPETKEITNLYISFYAPIEDKILKKIDAMRVGALYSGTILRFLPPTEERKHPYMIVKTDSGVEVLCTLPNWKKPPMEMDSVNVKIVEIRPNGQNTLVLGFIKR